MKTMFRRFRNRVQIGNPGRDWPLRLLAALV
jgi:hypothetical protein